MGGKKRSGGIWRPWWGQGCPPPPCLATGAAGRAAAPVAVGSPRLCAVRTGGCVGGQGARGVRGKGEHSSRLQSGRRAHVRLLHGLSPSPNPPEVYLLGRVRGVDGHGREKDEGVGAGIVVVGRGGKERTGPSLCPGQYLLKMSGAEIRPCTYGDMLIIHGTFFQSKKQKTKQGEDANLCVFFSFNLYFFMWLYVLLPLKSACTITSQKWVTRCFLASTSPEAEKPVPPPFRCSRSLS